MINSKTGARELAYVVRVDQVSPIEGADRIALAHVGGWRIIIKKGEFVAGDLAVFFEIDSHLPQEERYEFLAQKHYNVKTMKLNKFGVISQGLLMPLSEFPELQGVAEGDGLTEKLHITYAVAEDNKRKKEDPNAKYVSMKARHRKIFSNKYIKKLMKYKWFRELMFVFFGKKKDKPKYFPTHFKYIHKTDSERIENLSWLLGNGEHYIATEKLDGSSSTYILEKTNRGKYEFWVLSRNVRQFSPDQQCYHDYNIYWDMAIKYDIENKLKEYLETYPELDYVAVQGECVGKVQGNPLKLSEDNLYLFSFIRSDVGTLDPISGKLIAEKMGMNWVPILDTDVTLPATMDEMKQTAEGYSRINPDVLREGIVYRSVEHSNEVNFKNVANSYLLAHNN